MDLPINIWITTEIQKEMKTYCEHCYVTINIGNLRKDYLGTTA